MAYDLGPQTLISLTAAADLSANQYYVVRADANGDVLLHDDGGDEFPLGVLQNAPASGETANVLIAGVTKVVAGTSFNPQNLLAAIDTTGKVSNVIAGNYVIGQPITASGADGDIVTAIVSFAAPYDG